MPARVIAALARHGQYHRPEGMPSALLPHPLDETGEAQADALGAELHAEAARRGWRVHPTVDTSNLLRAWQTGTRAARAFAGAVEEFPALAERSVGAAANLTVAEIEEVLCRDPRYPAPPSGWKRTSDYKLPFTGAESLREAGRRVAEHVDARMAALADHITGDTVKLFVSHAGALRHAAVHLGFLEPHRAPLLTMQHASVVYAERQQDGSWRHLRGEWSVFRDEAG